MAEAETIFLTGFPGFIAGRLVEQLAGSRKKFFLLVQPAFLERAQLELRRIAETSGRSLTDFVMLSGDITEANLGMSAADLQRARAESNCVFHLAAAYDLAVPKDIGLRVNLQGTKNVNDFVRSLRSLRQYHYVSTCYVAGKRTGRVLETELRHDAGFRNNYEETKYRAELEVEELKRDLPVTIHRPSVVVGDSLTGETAKYDGIYYLIRYLLKWPAVLSILNIGNREVALNLVPVDFVVKAMATLAEDPLAIGKTVQLADPTPLSTRELFDTIAQHIAGKRSKFTFPSPAVHTSLMAPLVPRISGLPHSAVPYFFLKQTYDTSQATALLNPHGITCPPFRSYVEAVVDFVVHHPTLN